MQQLSQLASCSLVVPTCFKQALTDCCRYLCGQAAAELNLSLSVICMKKLFAALQLLQMMQQPNRYEGAGFRAKAHRPEQAGKSAKKSLKQAVKEKPGPSAAGKIGSKASSSLAHGPIHRLAKVADQGRRELKQPGRGSRPASLVPRRRL